LIIFIIKSKSSIIRSIDTTKKLDGIPCSGNFEITVVLVVADAGVSAANERGDTPLLVTVGAGKLELAEKLVHKGSKVRRRRSGRMVHGYTPWSSSRSRQS
jgi:ankyrin repeat protein